MGLCANVAGYEPDTLICPLLVKSRWLAEVIPAIATVPGFLFPLVSVWLLTHVFSNRTSCKILIIKLNNSPLLSQRSKNVTACVLPLVS